MSEPATKLEPIPSELVNLKSIYERRFNRRKESCDEKQRQFVKILEPFVTMHRKAVHAYEDHFDDGLLKYGRDPNQMPIDERDPAEVQAARKLKRAIEDAEINVRNKESELGIQFKTLPEFTVFRASQIEFEDWLSKVCIYLRCCPEDLDWNSRTINRKLSENNVPSDLLVMPASIELA